MKKTHLGTTNCTSRTEYTHTNVTRGQNTVLPHDDHIT